MTIEIGTRPTAEDDSWAELHLYDDGEPAVIVRSGMMTFTVSSQSGAVDFCEAAITVPDAKALRSFVQGRRMSIFEMSGTREPLEIMRGSLDFIDAQRPTRDAPYTVRIEARSVVSPLIDEGVEGSFDGTLNSIVSRLSQPFSSTVEADDEELRAWIHARSIYGVLRVLAVSFDSVVLVETDGHIAFRKRQSLLQERSQPQFSLTDKNALAVRMVRGIPVEKRTGNE